MAESDPWHALEVKMSGRSSRNTRCTFHFLLVTLDLVDVTHWSRPVTLSMHTLMHGWFSFHPVLPACPHDDHTES